jgi:phosphoribosylformylglycinamidine (FGAM) synthase PurS component
MFEAKVTIQLKKGVSDPEGVNTLKAVMVYFFPPENTLDKYYHRV